MSVLDELNQSLLSQKEISNLVSVEKPDFHFIINSRGHCLDFSEHKMKFEINLFLFLDNLPFVRDYLKLVKYGTDREAKAKARKNGTKVEGNLDFKGG